MLQVHTYICVLINLNTCIHMQVAMYVHMQVAMYVHTIDLVFLIQNNSN